MGGDLAILKWGGRIIIVDPPVPACVKKQKEL